MDNEIVPFLGKLPRDLYEMAFLMLRLMSECTAVGNVQIKESLKQCSMKCFTNGLKDIESDVVQNPSEVKYSIMQYVNYIHSYGI